MPHSIPSVHSGLQEDADTPLPDAPSATATGTTGAEDNCSPADAVMDIEDGTKSIGKAEVKLQDLFDDMDEDEDEFSSSRADATVKMESSPPAMPM